MHSPPDGLEVIPNVYCYSQFMFGQKLSIGLVFIALHAQGPSNSTPLESPTQSRTAELRARTRGRPENCRSNKQS